ncbi:MAG: class I adenylate-forming enzyme family protein [Oceanicoccus sp.]
MTEVNTPSRQELAAAATAPGQDYEIVAGEFWGRPCRVFKNAPQTLRHLYDDSRSDETFIVYEDERYSFEESWARSAQIGQLLVDNYGIQKGDRVAISMRNYPEWILSFNAVTSIGAVAVAMNSLWLSDEMAYGLNDSGAKVLFADQERLDRLEPVRGDVDVHVIAIRPTKALGSGVVDLEELLANVGKVDMPSVDNFTAQDPATIFYTSGSTGHPKGVLSCHGNIISALLSWELEAGLHAAEFNVEAPEDPGYQLATLQGVPLFHVTGSHAVMLSCHRAQRKLVCMYKWDANFAAELIDREKIASFVGPAAMTGDLVEISKETNFDLSSLAVVGGGGAPRAPDQVKNIGTAFANALPNTGWGMTETNAIGTGIGGQDYLDHPDSAGRTAAIVDVRIADEDGNEMPTGERGEVQIKGATLFEGYWNRPDANAEAMTGDWLQTGDVGFFDEEGYLYIVDRIKDLVIRGGENIGCAEVEAALLEHDQILEASVYGVLDERLGEEVGATIYCGGNSLSEERLHEFLVQRIARFKVPRYLKISVEPLPRIATGKIDKKRLREEARQEA